jgi:hypothetical protein
MKSLLARDRVGVAFRSVSRFLGEVSTELAGLDENREPGSARERARRAHLWMLRQDLAGYVVLGDPAVRLPLATGDPMATAAPVPRPAVPNTMDLLDVRASESHATPPLPIAELEQAIGKVLSGGFDAESVARAHGLTRAELERWIERYRAAGRAALTRA